MKLKDDTKRLAIIEETLTVVYNKGFAGIKMAQIAKAVNLSPSTLYVYFKNKDDLILSIASELIETTTADTKKILNQNLPYKLKLKAFWVFYLNFWINNAKEINFIMQVKTSPYYDLIPKAIRDLKSSIGISLLEKGKTEGLIKNIDSIILSGIMESFLLQTVKMIENKQLTLTETDTDIMFTCIWDAIKA
ncbi:TetR/AcrR family transcriptional regulator [Formosa sp. S-31]|uniref:TetR/AcrR family transcriptional regulator n=1 Tax=Formosa sp. S-31 TaxID=2790949 RepID=UPI003EB9F496